MSASALTRGWIPLAVVVVLSVARPAPAAELVDGQKLFNTGQYLECINACEKAIEADRFDEGWYLLKIRAELATGQYPQALETWEAAQDRHERSIPMLLVGHDVLRLNDRPDDAEQALLVIRTLAARAPWRYTDTASRVALGRSLVRSDADARQILELFYDQAKKDSPSSAEPWLASGELALAKHDYALAAESYQEAAKRTPDDPDVYYGLARSYENDAERAAAALAKALELNPSHADSLLYQADNLIDREDFPRAEALLKQVLEINPQHHRAFAYRAVLAHFTGDPKQEAAHRDAALVAWSTNPEVDHLIGQKLSQNYRFAEGAAYQRKALGFAPSYRPAKEQLCQDLLRLGQEDEGWRLATEVFKDDQYNVLAFNLVTLHDTLSKFRTLENDHFLVRMDQREAQVYGDRVVRLLERGRQKLVEKYGARLGGKVVVEIFPQQKDFAVRTFGLPGGEGFLGVCFGDVVTVNSPASRPGRPSNWEAVLWHEFCHVVTLNKTRNKMPRWLSEGISVYEERQEAPAWGQVMNPQYRELILAGGATPVSKLSSAFLRPPTPMHLQFAYYESSMVVEHVVERFGIEALRKVLADLGDSVPINDALAKNTEPIEQLDANFEKWLKEKADQLAAGVNWEKPKLDLDAGSAAMRDWNDNHPNSFWGLLGEGRALIAERKWKEAVAPLEKAAALYPGYGEAGGPYALLAAAHRELGDAAAERAMLERHVALDDDAVEPRLRLMEVAAAAEDWPAVRRTAEEALAINPLVPPPHRYLARAAAALGERPLAIEAHRTLLLLDPLDRADHHYQLARLLVEEKQLPAARQEVVRALEEAPRFRDAHRLLLEIVAKAGPEAPPASPPAPEPAEEAAPAPDAPADAPSDAPADAPAQPEEAKP
jgi:tetratricopeptide (TPR) repeat protein